MRHYSIEKTAGILIINKQNSKVLLIKSTGGFWGFAKGHREKEDKTVYDNALREVKEELKIKLKKKKLNSRI